jgi:hypothetical protein
VLQARLEHGEKHRVKKALVLGIFMRHIYRGFSLLAPLSGQQEKPWASFMVLN